MTKREKEILKNALYDIYFSFKEQRELWQQNEENIKYYIDRLKL